MTLGETRGAYAARAREYVDLFGSIGSAAEQDRQQLGGWARGIEGRVLDVGCGPGQWTSFLSEQGVDIEGIDPVHEFIEEARRRHPNVAYRVGQAERLDAGDATVGGILAWYSLIHTDPSQIAQVLTEFARCIRPGGGLAIGFFEGPELVPFDHAVVTAYFWPANLLSAHVEESGFIVTDTYVRADPGVRRLGVLFAQRRV